MIGLKYVIKTREYCDYLEEHLTNVKWAWDVLQDKCKDMDFIWDDYKWSCIDYWVKEHDLSKFSKEEFTQYRNNFFPVENESVNKNSFNDAWEHHKKENDHHWENWTKLLPDEIGEEDKISSVEYHAPLFCVHMIIDWMAMGKKFGDTAQIYYEANKDKIKLPDWAVRFIYEIFERVY